MKLLLRLVMLFACHDLEAKEPLRLSADLWVGYSPWSVASAKKLFKAQGADVEFRIFSEMTDSKKAFESGVIDIVSLTLHEVLLMKDKGVDCVIILLLDYSAGADALVAQKNITNIKQLKNKKVGAEIGTVSHFTLLKALEKSGMKETDINILNLGTTDLPEAFHSKKIAAASVWEPFVTEMTKDQGHVIFSSKEIPGSIVDVLVVKRALLNERKEDLVRVAKTWFNSISYFEKQREDSLKVMAKIHRATTEQLNNQLAGVHWTAEADNKLAMGISGNGSLLVTLKEFESFLREKKLIKNQFDLKNLFTADILKGAL